MEYAIGYIIGYVIENFHIAVGIALFLFTASLVVVSRTGRSRRKIMSDARECDVCGQLFKLFKGAVSLDVTVDTDDEGGGNTCEVHLCKQCGDRVLAIIKPALQDLEEPAPVEVKS